MSQELTSFFYLNKLSSSSIAWQRTSLNWKVLSEGGGGLHHLIRIKSNTFQTTQESDNSSKKFIKHIVTFTKNYAQRFFKNNGILIYSNELSRTRNFGENHCTMEKVVAFASEKKGRELKKLNEIFNFHSMKLKRARKLFNFSMFPVAFHASITHTRWGFKGRWNG